MDSFAGFILGCIFGIVIVGLLFLYKRWKERRLQQKVQKIREIGERLQKALEAHFESSGPPSREPSDTRFNNGSNLISGPHPYPGDNE